MDTGSGDETERQLQGALRQFQDMPPTPPGEDNKLADQKASEDAEAAMLQGLLNDAILAKDLPAMRMYSARLSALRGSAASAVSSAGQAVAEAETRISPVASISQTVVTVAAGAAMAGEAKTFFDALAKGGNTLRVEHDGSFDHVAYSDHSKLKKKSGDVLQDAFANIEAATDDKVRAKVMAETGVDAATLTRDNLSKVGRSLNVMEEYEAAKILGKSKSLEEAVTKIRDNHETFAVARAELKKLQAQQKQIDARTDAPREYKAAVEKDLQQGLAKALKPARDLLVKNDSGYHAVAGDVNQKNPLDLGGLVASLVPNVLKPKSKPPLAMPTSSQSV